jgi:hypothetical protein
VRCVVDVKEEGKKSYEVVANPLRAVSKIQFTRCDTMTVAKI